MYTADHVRLFNIDELKAAVQEYAALIQHCSHGSIEEKGATIDHFEERLHERPTINKEACGATTIPAVFSHERFITGRSGHQRPENMIRQRSLTPRTRLVK